MKLTLEIEQIEPGKFQVISPDVPDGSVYGIGIDPPSAIASFAERLGIFYQDLMYAVTKYPERSDMLIKRHLPYIQSLWNDITESYVEAIRERLLKKINAWETLDEADELDQVRTSQQRLIDSVWFLVEATQDAICYISNIEETDERLSKHLDYNYKKTTLPPTEGEQILEKLRKACLAVYGRRYGGSSCGNNWGDLVIAAPLMFLAICKINEWATRMTRCPFCGRIWPGHGHVANGGHRPELSLRNHQHCVMAEIWEAFEIVSKATPPWPETKNFVYPEKLTQENIEEIRVMALVRIADGDLETGVPVLRLIEHIQSQ